MDDSSNALTETEKALKDALRFAQEANAAIHAQLAAAAEAVANLEQEFQNAKLTITAVGSLQSAAAETNLKTAETNAEATAVLKALQEAATAIVATRVAVEQDQGIIATKSEHIEQARIHADKVREELDTALTNAHQSAVNSEAQHQASHTASDNLTALYSAAVATKASIDENYSNTALSVQRCEADAATTKKLADIASTTEFKINAYETRLASLDLTIAERLKTIEGLLPGATSAGLASAFKERCKHFVVPQRFWQAIFLGAISALVFVAAREFGAMDNIASGDLLQSLGVSLMRRLPIVLPLIWLAIHASHKGALAQRVEEDYAFKETVSSAFEGYRRELSELEGKASPDSPLARYCEGVLSVITNPPGRIYEKHNLSQTPLDALAESAGPIGDVISKATKLGLKVELPEGILPKA